MDSLFQAGHILLKNLAYKLRSTRSLRGDGVRIIRRILFCPKYRYRVFGGELGQYAHQQIERLLKQKELVDVIKLNVQPDHCVLDR